jgi:DNA-binding GntR family transcriptional regulator
MLRREVVRDALLRRIGSGELPAGTRIVESQLAVEFGVSSIPVREAIRELVSMGVLDFANHRGAWVREVSLAETIEALEVKAALEGRAALAAAPVLAGRCKPLRALCKALSGAARAGDFARYQELNHDFHHTIVAASGNALLVRIWDSLGFQVRTRVILEFLEGADPVDIASEHEEIVESLDEGRARRAASLLADHASGLIAHIRRTMEAAK